MPRPRKKAPSAARLRDIGALVLDCDGVLTTGELYYDDKGGRILSFYVRDGLGIALLTRVAQIHVAVLSGRPVDIAEHRHKEMGVTHFVGGCRDKAAGLEKLAAELGVPIERIAFMGDDVPDLPAMRRAGLGIAVGDAVPEVVREADWVTRAPGGRGAIREVCEAILKARGVWSRIVS